MPAANANGTSYDTFQFKVHDGTAYSASSYTITVDVTPVNDAPSGADHTVTTNEDTAYTFTLADFPYSDIDGDSLTKVQITALPTHGSLQLSGVDVTLDQEIAAAAIAAGNLKFTPAANANGTSYDTFQFKVHDGTAYSAVELHDDRRRNAGQRRPDGGRPHGDDERGHGLHLHAGRLPLQRHRGRQPDQGADHGLADARVVAAFRRGRDARTRKSPPPRLQPGT